MYTTTLVSKCASVLPHPFSKYSTTLYASRRTLTTISFMIRRTNWVLNSAKKNVQTIVGVHFSSTGSVWRKFCFWMLLLVRIVESFAQPWLFVITTFINRKGNGNGFYEPICKTAVKCKGKLISKDVGEKAASFILAPSCLDQRALCTRGENTFVSDRVCQSGNCQISDCCEPYPTCAGQAHLCQQNTQTLVSEPEKNNCSSSECSASDCCVKSIASTTQPTSEPTPQPTSGPATPQPISEPTSQPTSEPATSGTGIPTANSTSGSGPIPESSREPTTQLTSGPAPKPTSEPTPRATSGHTTPGMGIPTAQSANVPTTQTTNAQLTAQPTSEAAVQPTSRTTIRVVSDQGIGDKNTVPESTNVGTTVGIALGAIGGLLIVAVVVVLLLVCRKKTQTLSTTSPRSSKKKSR